MQKLTDKIKHLLIDIPSEIKQFALKGGLLLIGWCLLYGLLLEPYNLIDPVLTKYTTVSVTWLMQFLYHGHLTDVSYSIKGAMISIDHREVLYLGDPCNGLDIYVLFTGFILCVPMGVKKMAAYIFIGIAGIFVLNTIRCLALIYLYYHQSAYTDIAHHYIFQLIVYGAIFFIWERYFRSLKVKHEPAQV